MPDFKQKVLLLRRWALQNLVPEVYWPKTILIDGVHIKIRNTPYSFGTRWLIKKGYYEKEERELVLNILKPGMHVIEMGGSIGVLSAVMANAIGSRGKLVSVEASAKLSKYSTLWLEKLGNVKVITGYAFPVWKAPNVQINNFDEVTGSLGGTLSFDIQSDVKSDKQETDVYDVQKLCVQFGLQPNVLVADVEGSEIIMANQSPNLPSSIKFVLIELHDGLYANGKQDETLIHQAIVNDGFALQKRMANVCLYERGK